MLQSRSTSALQVAKILFSAIFFFLFSIGSVQSQQTVTWIADADGEWTNPDNWSPRGVPEADAIVRFNHDETFFISNVPNGTTILGLVFDGKGSTFLSANEAGSQMLIGEPTDTNSVFRVSPLATAVFWGSNESHWYLNDGLKTNIKGTMVVMGDELTPTHHAIIPLGETILKFESGSRFIQGNGFAKYTGHPFGQEEDGMEPHVIFDKGSKLIQYDGDDPFGPFPISKIKFQSGSTFEFGANGEEVVPNLIGRPFADFVFASFSDMEVSGSGQIEFENIDIRSSKLTFALNNGANTINIKGNIKVPNYNNGIDEAFLVFEPRGYGTINVTIGGDQPQTISGNSTIKFGNRAKLTVLAGAKVNIETNLEVNRFPIINGFGDIVINNGAHMNLVGQNYIHGSGRFMLLTNGTLGIGAAEGLTASGNTGAIRTATRLFQNAHFQYIGTQDQVTGDGLPTWNNALPRPSITIATKNNAKVTLTQDARTSILNLESGTLDLDGKKVAMRGITGGPALITGKKGTEIVANNGAITIEGAGLVQAEDYLPLGTLSLETGLGTGMDFGTTGMPTITEQLIIRSGGDVVNNAPFYGEKSMLVYAKNNTTINAGTEWLPNKTVGKGVPVHVQVGLTGANNTKLAFTGVGSKWYCNGLMKVGGATSGTGAGILVNTGAHLIAGPATTAN